MQKQAYSSDSLDEPFPLQSRFRRRFIPALFCFIGISMTIIGVMANQAVEAIYLELAQRRAQTIARAVASDAPAEWNALMAGSQSGNRSGTDTASRLTDVFAKEVRELRLSELKIYNLSHVVLYATNAEEIGTVETGDVLREVIDSSTPGILTKTLTDGTQQYELYVPVFDENGDLRTVFELYEPVEYLDAILSRAAIPIISIPGILFILLGIALYRLVARAQLDINFRTEAINGLRQRIESFVSATAVSAARRSVTGNDIASEKIETTLFFSDIRGFTSYSEQHSPEEVVSFLNKVMSLQVDIVKQQNGDIDKMIGDALLARFDGADGGERAIQSARQIQALILQDDYPRALGIGIFRGSVISGAIGPADRRDFTVIGDAVNIASRLCSAAAAGEIVVATELASDDFGPVESISVKGRSNAVSVRRTKVGS